MSVSTFWVHTTDEGRFPLGFIVEFAGRRKSREFKDEDWIPLPHGEEIPEGDPLHDYFKGQYPDLRRNVQRFGLHKRRKKL